MIVCKVKDIVIGEGMPKICVPVVFTNQQDIVAELIRLEKMDIDLIELRIDYFSDLLNNQKLTELFNSIAALNLSKGIILTYRSEKEGGLGKLTIPEYIELYKLALNSNAFDIYDVELTSGTNAIITLTSLIHQAGKKVLMSVHDFKRTPSIDTMMEKFKLMDSLEADIFKLAVMPEDFKEVLALMETTLKANELYDRPIVTMSMSSMGIVTRLMGEQFGSAITFGKAQEGSAPGQIDVQSLKQVLQVVHDNIEN